MLGLLTELVPCFLVRNNIFENGDIAMRPWLIYIHMLVFTHRLEVDRWAMFPPRIAAVDSERTLTAMFPLDARTGLASPFLVVCSQRILLSLCLETYRTFPIDWPWGTYPTPPLFRYTPLHDLEACGMTPARAVIASD
jgi:hypothetical protein